MFIAHGASEQWTLRENRRAFNDYIFTPHSMGGIVRDKIDTSITSASIFCRICASTAIVGSPFAV